MRKIITLLFLAAFCICSQAYSQNRADELMKQAQESLAKKNISKPAIFSSRLTMLFPLRQSMIKQ